MPAEALPPATLLIVDDDPVVRERFQEMLAADPVDLVLVGDGEAALKAAGDHSPDVLFLDLVLPGRDGLSILAELKRSENTRDIPVVITTSRGDARTHLNAVRAGAADILLKPFLRRDVRDKVLAQCGPAAVPHRTGGEPSREQFVLAFEQRYMTLVRLLAEERSADLQAALSTLLERLQLFQFETAREAVLQMLMAVSRDDLPAALTHLERLYHRFRTLARVLPPSR